MESPDLGHRKTRYIIKTMSASYGVSPTRYRLSWIRQKKVNPTSRKQVLRDVSCEVKPGEITAIAGPSGAGKTTLLEILAGVIPPCRVSGQVLVNDRPMNPNFFRRVSGYVTQEDLLFPLLTVEETLLFSARLRLHGGLADAKSRVHDLLDQLGLRHVAGRESGQGPTAGYREARGGGCRSASISSTIPRCF
ncbi:hypothetical protein OSB04_014393 [Centaurea solstitialis]|uniref:ABC transporter domain-containing protein n=1 Tax=Centaurea solstitialis TaxID=347529 RepID=A0AA38SX79_9ASTR|nr:hypothetical protein OSB04_014393 [Centaurea solstitialis]